MIVFGTAFYGILSFAVQYVVSGLGSRTRTSGSSKGFVSKGSQSKFC